VKYKDHEVPSPGDVQQVVFNATVLGCRDAVLVYPRPLPSDLLGASLAQVCILRRARRPRRQVRILFEYWDDRGRLTREVFRAWMAPVREQFEALLERAVAAKLDALSGSCADVLAHRGRLQRRGRSATALRERRTHRARRATAPEPGRVAADPPLRVPSLAGAPSPDVRD
jgi:hypothetical protein